jgi:hypothetical protein
MITLLKDWISLRKMDTWNHSQTAYTLLAEVKKLMSSAHEATFPIRNCVTIFRKL